MGHDDLNWHVAMARQMGDERLARVELDAKNIEVHVPVEYARLKMPSRVHVTADKLILSPYFFVRFHTSDDDEWEAVLAARGVKHVLTARTGGRPSVVHARIIAAHRSREYAEQHSATKRREKTENMLPLNADYRVLRGLCEGAIGRLIAVDRGIAHLDINGMIWKPNVHDIVAVPEKQKARAA